jgi:UPF0271 protein
LLDRVTSASISCGFHAGDESTIVATLQAARARNRVVGAHPGYADRAGFGRREQLLSSTEVTALIRDQVRALAAVAYRIGVPLRFLKPHGALYNQAQRDDTIATGVIAAARVLGLPLLGQPGSRVEALSRLEGARFIPEGFADRRYDAAGRLVPRTEPGAILSHPDEIRDQLLRLIPSGIKTVCIHGDNPDSVSLADRVRACLEEQGVVCRSFVHPESGAALWDTT